MKLSILLYAKKRIIAVLDEIDRLIESEFPHSYSYDALSLVKSKFVEQKSILDKVQP